MSGSDVAPFHRFARLYDLCMYSADAETLESGLAAADRPVERILDVGGGTGRVASALEGRGYETTVVDAARGMLAQVDGRRHARIQGDAARLPVGDATVDAVLVVDALHHMGDPDAVIAEAHRVLGPGGVFVVREFDPSTLRGRALVVAEHLVGFGSRFFTPEDLAGRIERAGFAATVPDRGFGYTVVGVAGERTSQVDGTTENT